MKLSQGGWEPGFQAEHQSQAARSGLPAGAASAVLANHLSASVLSFCRKYRRGRNFLNEAARGTYETL